MVLEAVMICVDNSEWMRNGDYTPTRMDAQREAVSYICTLKTQANAENGVGVLTMAGKRIDVLMTPGRDLGAVLSLMQNVRVGDASNFVAGLKTAQLCLKNRMNKNQRQRIIMFAGSPITHPIKELIRLGKQMKKNNVAVDVINFGQENTENENSEKLDAFVNAVNSSDNSHLVNVPPGPHNLSDMILTTIVGEGAVPGVSAGFGAAGDLGGVDPNMDPDLALAISMSLQDERERQERLNAANTAADSTSAAAAAAAQDTHMTDLDDEDAMMAQAIAMSMAANQPPGDTTMTDAADAAPSDQAAAAAAPAASGNEVQDALQDSSFMDSLIDSLPGVNQGDIDVQGMLESLNAEQKEADEKQKEKK